MSQITTCKSEISIYPLYSILTFSHTTLKQEYQLQCTYCLWCEFIHRVKVHLFGKHDKGQPTEIDHQCWIPLTSHRTCAGQVRLKERRLKCMTVHVYMCICHVYRRSSWMRLLAKQVDCILVVTVTLHNLLSLIVAGISSTHQQKGLKAHGQVHWRLHRFEGFIHWKAEGKWLLLT